MADDNKKKGVLKNNWIWIVFILFMLTALPYILNKLILNERCWEVVGGPKEWLAFWPSYLGAFASAVMIAYTAMTLKNNKGQLDELKREWDEEHKPNVSVSYHKVGHNGYLRVINISNVEIRNLSIEIINIPKEGTLGKYLEQYSEMKDIIEVNNMNVEPRGIRNIVLAPGFSDDLLPNEYIGLKLSYNQKYEKNYVVVFNSSYSIGDDIIGRELVDSIDRLKKEICNLR